MAEQAQTLSAEDLCKLTGLTDRRHRQLAQEGYFPHPVKSMYLLTPTIRGIFKYYREHNQQTREKIYNTKDQKTQKEVRLLDLKIAREERKVVDRAEVGALHMRIGTLMRGRLYAALEREYPGRVVGRTAAEISAIGRALADELMDIFSQEEEQWAASE
jgi:hypothetical protein